MAGYSGAACLALRAGLASAATADGVDITRLRQMEFDVTYRTVVHNLPADAEDFHLWMPLPPADAAQAISKLSVSCTLPHETTTSETYGNQIVHVRAASKHISADWSLTARYHVARKQAGSTAQALDAAGAAKYLRYTSRTRMTDEVEAFARNAIGDAKQPLEVARRVFEGIIEELSYDKQIPGCGTGDTQWIMRHKRGKCDDYHSLFMAILISRGIPVRWEQGFPLPAAGGASGQLSGDCSGAHCWVSFHDRDAGWVPVDVSEADKNPAARNFFFGKLSPNRFKVSEGRAIALAPKQGGDLLETFAYAYAEADGIPLIYPANYENQVQFTITRVEVA
ncbi:MAG: transglutaminase domain-containing protein [Deltaproteobacteria bacterium]|nr:transglutaminase domain-containing protein [Deltaproteobacteria bacterium]